ncbi:MAG: hypothetical protein AAF928_11175 [Myxococcota bacterium]
MERAERRRPPPEFDIVDIPQADDIDAVRAVVAAVEAGHTSRGAILAATGATERHMQYRVRAAVILGMVREGTSKGSTETERGGVHGAHGDEGRPGLHATERGRAWLSHPPRSDAERSLLRAAVRGVAALRPIAAALFGPRAPRRQWLATQLRTTTLMAEATAVRRASTLLGWRRRLMSRQLSLFDDLVEAGLGGWVEGAGASAEALPAGGM